MTGAIKEAQEIVSSNPSAFMLQQFENSANPLVHYQTTGVSDGGPSAFQCLFTGVSTVLRHPF
jgi:cysteine synthase